MRQDDRTPFDRALHRARVSAYAPGEFVGQESFMTAGEIRALAAQAGIGRGVAGSSTARGMTTRSSRGSRANAPGVKSLGWFGATRATQTTSSARTVSANPARSGP